LVQIFRLFWKEKKDGKWKVEALKSAFGKVHIKVRVYWYIYWCFRKKQLLPRIWLPRRMSSKKRVCKKKTLAGCHAAWHRWQWHCDNFSYIRARISHEFVRLVGILLRWSYPFAKIGGRNFFNPWRDKFHLDDITTTK